MNSIYIGSYFSGIKLFGFLLLLPILLTAQNPHSSYRHFTADDGLPSSEVYEILQDRHGYFWFATDNGVSRYNGYEFENFGALQGLEDPVVFHLQEDRKGRIWMQCMSGKMYYFERDSLYAFAGNKMIDSMKSEILMARGIHIDTVGQVYCSLYPNGLFQFSADGKGKQIFKETNGYGVCQVENKSLPFKLKSFLENKKLSKAGNKGNSSSVYPFTLYLDNGKSFHYELPMVNREGEVYSTLLRDHTLLVYNFSYLFIFKEGKLIKKLIHPEIKTSWYENAMGEIFMSVSDKGVRRYSSVEDIFVGHYEKLLEGEKICHIFEDRDGGYWFAGNENGVFYCPNPELEIYDKRSGLPDDYVTSVTIKNEFEGFLGFSDGSLVQLDIRTYKLNKRSHGGDRTYDLVYDPLHEALWAGVMKVVYFQNRTWNQVLRTQNEIHNYFTAKHFKISSSKNELWGVYSNGFNKFDLKSKVVLFQSNEILSNGKPYNTRTLDVFTTFANHTWVANVNGLFELRDKQLLSPEIHHTAFNARVEAIEELPDSTLVIGSKGYGIVFWKGNSIAALTQADGLTSNMIENLHVDDSGNLWAGTLNGLNKIQWHWDSKAKIENMTISHGLPSNEINRVASIGTTVWVATTKGLVRFVENEFNAVSHAPIITQVLAGNRSLELASPIRLAFRENDLEIHFAAINYKMRGHIEYRYRLDNNGWAQTNNTSLNFLSITAGEHIFEVKAKNEDGFWSKSSTFRFHILPPWWATWWARLSGAAMVIGIGITLYKYRTRQLKRENELLRQMTELERSALQAQMNPHFIFNCLNAIQNFIMQNEKDQAIEYLGSFAQLVRGVLNASVKGKVSLQEELKMLENYLSLEQLRFDKRFEYVISTSEGLDTFDIEIPPLLIQPYVENAVLHGMSNLEKKGMVTVSFQECQGYLEVSVKDNGKGVIKNHSERPVKSHKSVGMAITQKRLEIIGDSKRINIVEMVTLKDEADIACGTEVKIKIQFVNIKRYQKNEK